MQESEEQSLAGVTPTALGDPVPQRGAGGLGEPPMHPMLPKRHKVLKWFCDSLLTQRLVQLCHLRVVPARRLGLVAGSKTDGDQESIG